MAAKARVILRVTKVSPAARGLVVEQDAVGSVQPVAFAVVARNPVGVQLGRCIRAARLEGGALTLRGWGGSEHLAGGGLVVARLDAAFAHRLQDADGAQPCGIPGVLGHVKADAHMRLGCQVVNLLRANVVDHVQERIGSGDIAVVQVEMHRLAVGVRVMVEVVDAARVEGAGAADEAVNLVTLPQQQFR